MRNFSHDATSLISQVGCEFRLFWRRQESVYLNFFVPMLGMAMLVYLSQEGALDKLFSFLSRGLGQDAVAIEASPMAILTVGLATYCIITVAFEGLTPATVRQRQQGILKQLHGTPLPAWVFILAKTLSVSVLAFIEVALALAMGIMSTEIKVQGNWFLLATILLMGTLTLTAMSFILSSLVDNTGTAIMAVHAIYIPVWLLCGAFVPVEFLPGGLHTLAKLLPLTYFVRPFRNVMVEGTGLAANGTDLLILLCWLIGLSILAIKFFRWE